MPRRMMMSRKDDYIPANDAELVGWIENFASQLAEHLDEFQVPPDQLARIISGHEELEAAVAEQDRTRREALAATAHKRSVRTAIESEIRRTVCWINEHPDMENGLRARMGLNVRTDARVRREVGDEVPRLLAESGPGAVAVHFGEHPQNERINKRPKWTRGCVIYRRIDDEKEFSIIGYATSSPFIDHIDKQVARVCYMGRYRGAGNRELGYQSPTFTVAAWSNAVQAERPDEADAA